MRKHLIVSALVAGSLVPALALAAAPVKLESSLTGAAEVPAGATAGSGTAEITVTGRKVCWDFTVKGIGAPVAAHIHKGKAGKAGPVVVPLGATYKRQGCTTTTAATAKAIVATPGAYYVNIHTTKFPSGAVRGQLRKHT